MLLVEANKKELLVEEEKLKNIALEKKDKLSNYSMTFSAKVQEEDIIFGSISLQNILEKLNQDGHLIEKKQINLPSGSIKALGKYSAHINLHPEVDIAIPIEVKEEANILPNR